MKAETLYSLTVTNRTLVRLVTLERDSNLPKGLMMLTYNGDDFTDPEWDEFDGFEDRVERDAQAWEDEEYYRQRWLDEQAEAMYDYMKEDE